MSEEGFELAPELVRKRVLPDVEDEFPRQLPDIAEPESSEAEEEEAPLPPPPPRGPPMDLVFSGAVALVCLLGLSLAICASSRCPRPVPAAPRYPRWHEPHETRAHPFAWTADDRRVLDTLRRAFAEHAQAPCLCMHHLQVAQHTRVRAVCAVGSVVMVNPQMHGSGATRDRWRQHSALCGDVESERYRTVYMQWDDPEARDAHRMRLDGETAACMQLALEEMQGNVSCSLLQ